MDMAMVAREQNNAQPGAEALSPTEAWRYADALAVLLSRGTSTAHDVAGLGPLWALGAQVWLSTNFPYLVLVAYNRDTAERGSPGAFMARNADALRHAVGVLAERVNGRILWVNCGDAAGWQVVHDAIAEQMPTEGRA
jgi:hypothetical protein